VSEQVLAPVRDVFREIATTVVPEAVTLDAAGWTEAEALIEAALVSRPPSVHRQLRLLVRVIDALPLLRYGRRFTALDDDRRALFLGALQDAPLLLLRRGIWGLRTLIMLGYYARPAAAVEIGYRASPKGWEVRL
jgi:hypothetical protein